MKPRKRTNEGLFKQPDAEYCAGGEEAQGSSPVLREGNTAQSELLRLYTGRRCRGIPRW